MNFSKELISWYQNDHRDLPWRNTSNPYHIWLSEIILQQTRVDQGLEYYKKFVENFPTVSDLANADEDLVLKNWQGLGYYSRARNLHKAAKIITEEYKGKFPDNYDKILTLPGIGPYTAAAIASFAFKEAKAVVDGNVYRVLSRVFGIDSPIDLPAGQKEFKSIAQELIDIDHPDLHNQAIMEFGAMCCTPKQPKCKDCVFSRICIAQKEKRTDELPVKAKKTKVKELHIYYAVQKDDSGNLLLRQRKEKGIWHKLWDFPGIESHTALSTEEAIQKINEDFSTSITEIEGQFGPYVHLLSHRKIYAHFFLIRAKRLSTTNDQLDLVNENDYSDYAIPRLIEKFWEDIHSGATQSMF